MDGYKIVSIDELMEDIEVMGKVNPSLDVLNAGEHPIGEPSSYYLTRKNNSGLELRTREYDWFELENILRNFGINIYLLGVNANLDAKRFNSIQ